MVDGPFFQVGMVVPDIDAARAELSRALGLTWGPVVELVRAGHALRGCFSEQGPPYLELLQGPPGSPWDPAGGPRLDHLGFWASDLDSAADAVGSVDVDGRPDGHPFTYHEAAGVRVELIAASARAAFYERWGLHDVAFSKREDAGG